MNASDKRVELFEAARAMTPLVGVEALDGALYLVSTSDEAVGGRLFARRTRGEMGLLQRAVEQLRERGYGDRLGGTFVDVGANIGTTTITALRLDRPFERAVALEPGPENLRVLRANLALNGLEDRVVVLGLAVSNEPGRVGLRFNEKNSGDHRVVDRAHVSAGGPGKGVEVKSVAIRDLMAKRVIEPETVGLLWIDVQGHEGHVLSGAAELLREGTPVVTEFAPRLLESAGGLELFDEAVTEHFDEVVDMRRRATTTSRPAAQAVAELTRVYGDDETPAQTDLLLIPRQAA